VEYQHVFNDNIGIFGSNFTTFTLLDNFDNLMM